MKLPANALTSLALAMSMMLVSFAALRGQLQPASKAATATYLCPKGAEGLHQLQSDLLLAAKNDDQSLLKSRIAEMEIPDYSNWVPRKFGHGRGTNLAAIYGRSPLSTEIQFHPLWMELAKQAGEILLEKVDTANGYGTLADPLDEYTAAWKKSDSSEGPNPQSIGHFYFVDGKLRANASLHDVQIPAPTPGKAGRTVVPGRLISKVEPVYPENAGKLRIQDVVSVNVLVRKDGTVDVRNVGVGHPLLAPAAAAALQKWRYQPTTLDGDPVDIATKAFVTFSVTRSENEPK